MTIGRIPSVEGGIQPTIVDAKGDILTATAADTPAVLAVGNNGETLVADSSATTGLRWQSNFSAGKNKIINGDFNIWQRGTSFTHTSATTIFSADRFAYFGDGTSAARTISQQTFTPGTAPVSGYEGTFFLRINQTVAGTGGTENSLYQPIEDVRTFANQTVTVSFWAKADATRTVTVLPVQRFGSGGSSQVIVTSQTASVSTSWTRYSFIFSIPSVSGKTIGSGSNLAIYIQLPVNTTQTWDFWGVQVEAGSTATAFQTATGTLAGELAACQRYFRRYINKNTYEGLAVGFAQSTTRIIGVLTYAMRSAPSLTVSAAGDFLGETGSSGWKTVTATGLYDATALSTSIYFDVASGFTTGQSGRMAAGNTNATLDLSAEL